MLFYVLVIITLIHVVQSKSLTANQNNQILRYQTDTHSRQEYGRPGHYVRGSYSFLAGDGRLYTVNYVADEKGYRAQGSHVPWPPVINTVKDQPQVLLVDAGKDVVEMPKDPVKTVKMEPESVKKGDDKNSVDIQIIKTQNDSITNEGFAIMEVIPATGGATEKLTIHVPLISKVYSLLKPSKLAGKGMRKDGKSSRIIRYKLAYQPSYGGNVLTPIMD